LIFVAFLVPLAIYLLVLGYINRQPRPLMVSGTWDFIGVLFAASGFLLLGGPAILSSFNERWRVLWLLGEGSTPEGLSGAWSLGMFLAALYFLVVVAGSGLVFWRQRGLTSIYNVEPSAVEGALGDVCDQLGLDPIRSGKLFVFGLSLEGPTRTSPSEGIQAPHFQGPSLARQPTPGAIAPGGTLLGAEEFLGQNAILELESFESARHVTLRWDPPESPLRPVLEAELDRRLGLAGSPDHDTGLWLGLAGFTLLAAAVLIVFALVLRSLLAR
jgi:hypothetical protein